MIKTVGRTFIILIAAGLIALGWYAFSTTVSSQMTEPPDRPAEFTQTDGTTSEMSQVPPARPDGEEMGFSFSRILTGMAANVGITALVIGLVILFRKWAGRFASTPFKLVGFQR